MKLRPVSFRYKPQLDPTGLHQYGLIAEEVLEVYPDLVTKDDAGRPLRDPVSVPRSDAHQRGAEGPADDRGAGGEDRGAGSRTSPDGGDLGAVAKAGGETGRFSQEETSRRLSVVFPGRSRDHPGSGGLPDADGLRRPPYPTGDRQDEVALSPNTPFAGDRAR